MAASPFLPTKFPDKVGFMQGILSSEDPGICMLCQANLQSYRSSSVTKQVLVDNISVMYKEGRKIGCDLL